MSQNRGEQNTDTRWWNDGTLFVYHFTRSTYITVLWNWLLIFLSRAAEPFLFATVLYNGYKLLPGVPEPPTGLDTFMFIGQQATLDIGGLGLIKQAQQKGGRRTFAYWLGIVLVGLMIANMVVSSIERVASLGSATQVIEGLLLIIRAVMAVLYGYAVHSLRTEDESVSVSVVKAIEVHARLDTFQQTLSQSETLQQERMLKLVEAVSAMGIEFQSCLDAAVSRFTFTFNTEVETRLQVLSLLPAIAAELARSESERQDTQAQMQTWISQMEIMLEQHNRALPRQLERILSEQRTPPAGEQSRSVKKVLTLPDRTSDSSFNRRHFVFKCLDEDRNMKLEEMVERAKAEGHTLSTGSASQYRTEWLHLQQDEGEAESEAVGE